MESFLVLFSEWQFCGNFCLLNTNYLGAKMKYQLYFTAWLYHFERPLSGEAVVKSSYINSSIICLLYTSSVVHFSQPQTWVTVNKETDKDMTVDKKLELFFKVIL